MSQEETTKTSSEDTTHHDESEVTVDPADSQVSADEAEQTEDTPVEQVTESGQSALEKQVKEYLEGWQRERSEFANYKRRVEREMKDLAANASAGAFMSLLPVIDDFDRAFTSIPEDLTGNAWIDGISGIQRKFQKIMEDQGITAIDPVGEIFDPSRHEAVGTEDSDAVESGHVTATLQKGYVRGDRVLRPALVRVAS